MSDLYRFVFYMLNCEILVNIFEVVCNYYNSWCECMKLLLLRNYGDKSLELI